jgi:transcriptional regulator with XRE-family HTH domain
LLGPAVTPGDTTARRWPESYRRRSGSTGATEVATVEDASRLRSAVVGLVVVSPVDPVQPSPPGEGAVEGRAAPARNIGVDGDVPSATMREPKRELMPFGRAVKDARVRRGMTQIELANRLKTTQSAVSAWESGRAVPNIRGVAAAEKVLGLDRGELSRHLRYAPVDAPRPSSEPRVEEAIRQDRGLDGRGKAALIAAYRELVRSR